MANHPLTQSTKPTAENPAPNMERHPAPSTLKGNLAILRAPQRDAIEAFTRANRRGIVILPCGTGKTAVMLKCLCDCKASKAILITTSNQAAKQLKNDIISGTTINPSAVRVLTGVVKEQIQGEHVVIITTYTLFGRDDLSWETMFHFEQIKRMKFDFVGLDEVHSAPAAHVRKFVSLIINSPFVTPPSAVLALTATLFRERGPNGRVRRKEDGDELSIDDFTFIGNVVYRATWSAMQLIGVIAKLTFIRVNCYVDASVNAVIEGVEDLNERNDLLALPPSKAEAAGSIARLHRSWGHQVLVFVERLVLVQILVDCNVFPGFEVVSGERTPEENSTSLARLDAGEIPGLILSRLGDTAINLTSPRLQCLIKLDGPPRSRCRDAQRTGRVARTPDVGGFEGETDEAATARRRNIQKTAFVYSMVTEGEPETSGAIYREHALRAEGYLLPDEDGPDELKLHSTSVEEVLQNSNECRFRLTEPQKQDLIARLATRQRDAEANRKVKTVLSGARKELAKEERETTARLQNMKSVLLKKRAKKMAANSRPARQAAKASFLAELAESTRASVRGR